MLVPIRLISTDNPEIRNSIIKATNRQTEVTEEQLFALADFPKKLESYFTTFEGNKRIYYERRSRQYNSEEGIEKVRIINMTNLIRAYAAIFLSAPHRTTRNYKALLKSVGTDIFSKDHKLEMYYASAYAHYKLEYFFRNQTIDSTLKPARYHLLYLYRILTNNNQLPRFNSHDMARYCENFIDTLWDDDSARPVFQLAAEIITQAADGNIHRDNIRTEPFTELVKQVAISKASAITNLNSR